MTTRRPHLTVDKARRSSYGSGYNSILEHVMTFPGTFPTRSAKRDPIQYTTAADMPPPKARTGYNSARSSTVFLSTGKPPGSASTRSSTVFLHTPKTASPADAADLTAYLVNQIGSLPSQRGSLPFVYLNSFLRECFPPELELVDFPQALTGLDHLSDLESRRRREMDAALKRLGVSRDTLRSDADNVGKEHPSIATWVLDVEPNERRIEAMYTQLYVVLRRWILINEFSLVPFNRPNCVAMLNTLFPPILSTDIPSFPTKSLTPGVLHAQRETYIRWMKAVEKSGPPVLQPLIVQNKKPEDENGWPAVRDTLDQYLRVTGRLIDEASAIDDWGSYRSERDLEPKSTTTNPRRRSNSMGRLKRKMTDSGVSFDGSTASTSSADSITGRDLNKPSNAPQSPTAPSMPTASPTPTPAPPITSASPTSKPVRTPAPAPASTPTPARRSTLEKIVHELRKFRSRAKGGAVAAPQPTREEQAQNHPDKENRGAVGDALTAAPPLAPPSPAEKKPQTAAAGSATGKTLRRLRSFGDVKSASSSRPQTPRGAGAAASLAEGRTWRDGRASHLRDKLLREVNPYDDDEVRHRFSCDQSRREVASELERPRSRSRSRGGGGGRKMHAGDNEAFDREEMRRQRAAWEARHKDSSSASVAGSSR